MPFPKLLSIRVDSIGLSIKSCRSHDPVTN